MIRPIAGHHLEEPAFRAIGAHKARTRRASARGPFFCAALPNFIETMLIEVVGFMRTENAGPEKPKGVPCGRDHPTP